MKAKFNHFNFNVLDLEKSKKFYADALGLKEESRLVAEDDSFILVYMFLKERTLPSAIVLQ